MQLDPLTLITLATLAWWGRWLLKLARQPLPDEGDGWDVLYGVAEEERQEQERKLAKEREAAAEPKPAPPSDDPWAVIGKAEDDGDRIMDITRNFC